MKKSELSDVNISNEQILITPDALKAKIPLSDKARKFIRESRQTVADIIHKRDPRLLIVCGPCSIHDVDAAKEYAKTQSTLGAAERPALHRNARVL